MQNFTECCSTNWFFGWNFRKAIESKRKELEEKEKKLIEFDRQLQKRKEQMDQLEKSLQKVHIFPFVSKDCKINVYCIFQKKKKKKIGWRCSGRSWWSEQKINRCSETIGNVRIVKMPVREPKWTNRKSFHISAFRNNMKRLKKKPRRHHKKRNVSSK